MIIVKEIEAFKNKISGFKNIIRGLVKSGRDVLAELLKKGNALFAGNNTYVPKHVHYFNLCLSTIYVLLL
jgi:hypothetical protein